MLEKTLEQTGLPSAAEHAIEPPSHIRTQSETLGQICLNALIPPARPNGNSPAVADLLRQRLRSRKHSVTAKVRIQQCPAPVLGKRRSLLTTPASPARAAISKSECRTRYEASGRFCAMNDYYGIMTKENRHDSSLRPKKTAGEIIHKRCSSNGEGETYTRLRRPGCDPDPGRKSKNRPTGSPRGKFVRDFVEIRKPVPVRTVEPSLQTSVYAAYRDEPLDDARKKLAAKRYSAVGAKHVVALSGTQAARPETKFKRYASHMKGTLKPQHKRSVSTQMKTREPRAHASIISSKDSTLDYTCRMARPPARKDRSLVMPAPAFKGCEELLPPDKFPQLPLSVENVASLSQVAQEGKNAQLIQNIRNCIPVR